MQSKEAEVLLKQIISVLKNEPLQDWDSFGDNSIDDDKEAFLKIKEAMIYLSDCIKESNAFVKKISKGDLSLEAPGRYNFLVGELKQLHSNLRHLAWQTNQVVKGDYSQKVTFSEGNFANSFNTIIKKLAKQEKELYTIAESIEQSRNLLVAVTDVIEDWLIVLDNDTKEIIYANKSARDMLFNASLEKYICANDACILIEKVLIDELYSNKEKYSFEIELQGRHLYVNSYLLEWEGKGAYAYLISDVTIKKELEQTLSEMVYKDDLTGVYNRRHCINNMQNMLERQESFVICFIDMDDLKQVNDKFGHNEGDQYIKNVAELLEASFRETDIVCRFGGDEFIVLLPQGKSLIAKDKLEKVRKKLLQNSDEYIQSVSFGVVDASGGTSMTMEELIQSADSKMYKEKLMRKKMLQGEKTL